jgi:O-antigen/teichoic acid export membrane protein
MVNYTERVIKGTYYVFAFSILGALFAYIARIALSRTLTLEEFGLFFAVFAMFNFLALFKSMGLGRALVKFISEYKSQNKNNHIKTTIFIATIIQMLSTFIFALLLIVLAKFLSENYFKNELAIPIIYLLSIWFILSSFQGTVLQIFYGLNYLFLYSLGVFLNSFFYSLVLIFLLLMGVGFLSPAYAWIINSLLIIILFLPLLFKKYNFLKYTVVESKKVTKKLILFGLPMMLTMAGQGVIGLIDTLILTYFRDLSEVGVYNVILPTSLLLLFIGRAVSIPIFTVSSEMWINKQTKRLSEGLKIMQKYIFLVVIPLGLALMYFAKDFLFLFFGEEFVPGVTAFRILVLGTIFYSIAHVNNTVISGIGKPKTVTKIILLGAALNTIINLLIIPIYGMIGAAFTTALSYIFVCWLSIKGIKKHIDFHPPWKEWIKSIFGGILFVGIIYLSKIIINLNPWIEMIIGLSLAGVVYLLWLFVTKVITLQEVLELYLKKQ